MLRLAVIGAGHMGKNHIRVLADLSDVMLVGVADPNQQAALAAADRYGIPTYATHNELLDKARPEAVVVAAPTTCHHDIVMDSIHHGVHVLVEKPIAHSVEEAKEMIDAADRAGVVLAVGHIERFNPAVVELKRRIDANELGRIFMIHSRRQSPFPQRIQDVGVASDLAVHELDMMLYLTGSQVAHLKAETSQVLGRESREDIVFALLRFESGVLGVLDVNWVTPSSVRELTITGERGMFAVNYLTQELFFYENPAARKEESEAVWGFSVVAGNMTRFLIPRREPLRCELESFVASIQNGARPVVDGRDGLRAVELALRIVDDGKRHGSNPNWGGVNA
jgi:UDP-N-acetylglucosamine 3-dehydrogenase